MTGVQTCALPISPRLPEAIALGRRLRHPIVGTVEPWQQMFICVGAPGLLIALLLLTVREPVRRELADATQKIVASPISKTLAHLLHRWRAFIVLFFALAGLAIMAYGVGFWIPEFLRRTYALDPEQLGYWLKWRGIVSIIFGLIGVVVGGWLCDIFQNRYEDGYVRVCIVSFVVMAVALTRKVLPAA